MKKPHEQHAALADAFQVADTNTPRTKEGNGSFGFAKTGLPISPAREASVKKAALASAASRGAKVEAAKAVAPALGVAPLKKKGLTVKKGLLGM